MNFSDILKLLTDKDMKANTATTYITSFKRLIKGMQYPKADELTPAKREKLLEKGIAKLLATDLKLVIDHIKKEIPKKGQKTIFNGYVGVKKATGVDVKDCEPFIKEFRAIDEESRLLEKATPKQQEQKINYDNLKEMREAVKKEITDKFTTNDSAYVMLSMFISLPPMRAQDYRQTRLLDEYKDEADIANYICLRSKTMVLREFKNAKVFGTRTIELDDEILEILSAFKLKSGSEYLICNTKKEPYSQTNFTHWLNKVIGPGVATTMLRNIYVSEQHDKITNSVEKRKKDAYIMAHGITTSLKYYNKFSSLCNDDKANEFQRVCAENEELKKEIERLKEQLNK